MEKDVSSKRSFWLVRKYEKGDEHGILKLFRLCGIKRTSEEWLWEYRDNPFGSFIMVGEHDGQIVGHMAYVPALVKIGEKTGIGCQAVDVVVHPKFRGQGMFLTLAKTQFSQADKVGTDVVYGFPNYPSGHLKAARALGGPRAYVVCKVPKLIKFIDVDEPPFFGFRRTEFPAVPKIVRNLVKILFKMFLTVTSLYSRTLGQAKDNNHLENIEIHTVKSFDDRIDAFWKTVSRYHDIIVVRNRKYLNWRYFERPNGKYTVLQGERNGKILGYIVVRCRSEKNLKIGYIVDVLASSKSSIESLILKAIEYLKRENVNLIRCLMLKNQVGYKILRSYNFIPIGSVLFLARGHSPIPETFIKDYTKWYVTLGDTDHV